LILWLIPIKITYKRGSQHRKYCILEQKSILPSECKWLFKIKNAKAGNTGAEIMLEYVI
jgi:hypothetical protein